MKTGYRRRGIALAAVGLTAVSGVGAPWTAAFAATGAKVSSQAIAVTIDDTPVSFGGQEPMMAPDGTILVPLRGIFERLGAKVEFTAATRTIVAKRGETEVLLRIGEAVGYVNNVPKTLSVPAQILGTATLVPLRFVSEAFGAKVKWDAAGRVVRISSNGATPIDPVAENGGTPVKKPDVAPVVPPETKPVETKPATPAGAVAGTIASVDLSTRSVVVRTATGTDEAVTISADAVVLVAVGTLPAVKRELDALKPGDTVTVRRDSTGAGIIVDARYDERVGTLRAIEPIEGRNARVLNFTDGAPLEVPADIVVTRKDQLASLADVVIGDRLAVRINPTTRTATALVVVPPEPGRVEIAKVTATAPGRWLKSGESASFTVVGTAGAKGVLRIVGLPGAESLALVETSPGMYLATLALPDGLFVKDATALATLTIDPVSSPTVATTEPFSIDTTSPMVSAILPAEGAPLAEPRPTFSATLADTGSGIDAKSSQLWINGVDVTAQAIFTDSFLTFRPGADFSVGKVPARLVVKDKAGNETRREWTLELLPTAILKSVAVFPEAGKPLDFGDILTVKVDGVPGASASFSVGDRIKNVALTESTPGVYIGSYTVRREDAMKDAPLTVRFTPAGGATLEKVVEKAVTITAGAPDIPIIDLPQEGASVGNSVVVTGRTVPNASVKLTIKYTARRASVISASGQIAEITLKADERGIWASEPIVLKTPGGLSNVTFSLEAVAIGTGGAQSAPATVRFRR